MKFIIIILLLYMTSVHALQNCDKDIYKTIFVNRNTEISVLVIWYPAPSGSEHTLRLCSSENGLPLQRYCLYNRSSVNGQWSEIPRNIKLLNCSDINSTCQSEPFKHNYIMKNNVTQINVNKWNSAQITEIAELEKPCLRDSGLPVTRKCLFNAKEYHAQWAPIDDELKNVSCLRDIKEKVVTYDLSGLYNKVKLDEKEDKIEPKIIADKMTEVLTTPDTTRIPADIKLSAEILKIITEDDKNKNNIVEEVLNITNIMMATKTEIIRASEAINATSTFLKITEKYFDSMAKHVVPTSNCANISDGIVYTTYEYTSQFFINPSCSNISGVALYNFRNATIKHDYHYDKHTRHHYRFLHLNQSLDQLLNEPHLRLATYFPLSLWTKLKENITGVNSETVLRFRVFKNDILFPNQTVMELQPTRRVLEISIPDYSGNLPEDVPYIMRYKSGDQHLKKRPLCGYWNESTWITTGVKTTHPNNSYRYQVLCHSTHLSNFAALMGYLVKPEFAAGTLLNIITEPMLDYISIAGCGLSLFGLVCIWLTAIFFKSWRSKTSNKVLLNMCFVLTLIMVFFLCLNMPDMIRDAGVDIKNPMHCVLMGGFLHYSVLVLFTWMLIIAIMQYQRYVQVLGVYRPSKFITKYAIIAWSVPLLPTCLAAILDGKSYMPSDEQIRNNAAICYPKGMSVYYFVILPMSIIIIANLVIFIYICCSICRSMNKFKRESDRKNIISQMRLTVLLFFLLGISWIFGMLTHLDTSQVFSYLFCLTSTLQGFVLFIYFVVIDQSTRHLWITCCNTKHYYTGEEKHSSHMALSDY